MGEIADEIIDRMLDHDWCDGVSAYGSEYPTSIRCKRCGSGPFDWENFGTMTNPVWKLVDDDGNRHACALSPKVLGFEDLT